MSLRLINSVLHDLSGTQILHTMLRYFEQDRHSPVTLMTGRGQGEVVIQKVRTALTRTRRHTRDAGSPIAYFGFSTEGPLRIKIDGVDHDAYAVQFHVTGLQKMKNLTLTRLKDLAL